MTPQTSIAAVRAREIIDSRGNPTVECEITLASGAKGRAIAPSGASTGAFEAHELRDADERFGGKGVLDAVRNVEERLGPELIGRDGLDQRGIDDAITTIDATPSFRTIGANAALSASLAVPHAVAAHLGISLFRYLGGPSGNVLPVPFMNVLNGGAHADNAIDIQEFFVAPIGASTFAEALRMGAEVYQCLRAQAKSANLSVNVGDEGGIAPNLNSSEEALDLISSAVERAGYELGTDIALALDVAATELFEDGVYTIENNRFDAKELSSFLANLVDRYQIISIEDGCAEDDWDGWSILFDALGERIQLVADDLVVTNLDRLAKAIEIDCANALLVKPNQIGTLSATLDAIALARKAGWSAMVSHRSGETEDVTIAHLAVATSVGQIKAGAPARGERTAKYNELLRIEEELGDSARYGGWDSLPLGIESSR